MNKNKILKTVSFVLIAAFLITQAAAFTFAQQEENATQTSISKQEKNSFSPFAVDEIFTVDGINYKVLSEDLGTNSGTVEVTVNTSFVRDNLTIPSLVSYGGIDYSVVSIAEDAFHNVIGLTGILTIPSSVKYIGEFAFTKTRITKVNLPTSGLEVIDFHAFQEISTLSGEVTFPSSLTTIGAYSFLNTNITKVNFPDTGSINIGEYAFYKLSSLTGTLKITPAVYNISARSFMETGLTGLEFTGEGIQNIGLKSFSNIPTLSGEIIFPDSLRYIANDAFENATGINKVVFNNTGIAASIMLGAFITSGADIYYPIVLQSQYESRPGIAEIKSTEPQRLHPFGATTATIDSFEIDGVFGLIDEINKTISIEIDEDDFDASSLVPDISFTGKTISPNSGVAQDFRNPVEYIVTPVSGAPVRYTVNLYSNISIKSQPDSVEADSGADVFFEVTASGTPLNYQWQSSIDGGNTWVDLAGEASMKSSKLELSNVRDSALFRVKVFNSKEEIFSSPAELKVLNQALTSQSDEQQSSGQEKAIAEQTNGKSAKTADNNIILLLSGISVFAFSTLIVAIRKRTTK